MQGEQGSGRRALRSSSPERGQRHTASARVLECADLLVASKIPASQKATSAETRTWGGVVSNEDYTRQFERLRGQ